MVKGSLQTYDQYCRSSCQPELQDSYSAVVSTHVGDRLVARGLLLRQRSAGYSQPPHGGDDSPGVGRRAGLGAHCIGCEADRCLEHKKGLRKKKENIVATEEAPVNKMQARCLLHH